MDIQRVLELDVVPKQIGATIRLPGAKPERCDIEMAPGGLLKVRAAGAYRGRRGLLVAMVVNTKTRMYTFHADVYGTEAGALLIDRPRLLECHQRRAATRQRDAELQLRVRYMGDSFNVVVGDLSPDGVGFLYAAHELPALTKGERIRARIERRLGEGVPMVLEIVQLRPAPGTGLEFCGCRIASMQREGRAWLCAQLGLDESEHVA